MSKAPKSKNPAYPDAKPTAPGGMSQKQLVAELVRDTDMTKTEAESLIWREQIERVIESRKAIEARLKAKQIMAKPDDTPAQEDEPEDDDTPAWEDEPEDDDDDDLDAYLLDSEPEPDAKPAPTIEEVAEFHATYGGPDKIEVVNVDEACDLHELTHCAECNGEAKAHDESLVDDDIDPDNLLAEMEQAQAEAEAEKPPPLFLGIPSVMDYIFDGHAGAGPSAAERWMNCTASLEATRRFLETLTPNQQVQFAGGTMAARQGTTAHAAAEVEVGVMMGTVSEAEAEATLLELTVMPPVEDEAYDSEMAEYITEYVDLVKQYVDGGHTVLVEQRVMAVVPLTKMLDDGDDVYVIQGSGDFIALPTPEEKVLTVGDLKYGDGLYVEVEDNPQVRIYGLGALTELADEEGNLPDIERIDYHIIQPRMGGIRTWSESVEDLLAWRDEVLSPALTAALLGQKGGATFNPGEQQCQWCPVVGACPALATQRVEQASELFDVIVESEFEHGPGAFPETTSLDNDTLGNLLLQIEGLTKIKDDLKEEAERRLHRGEQVTGYELVSYTPPRKWTENAMAEVEHRVTEPLYKPKALLTPKQAITLLGEQAALIEDLIDTPPKRPVIARIERGGDRRKTWEGRAPEDMFSVVES